MNPLLKQLVEQSAEKQTPVTVTMDHDIFVSWLCEIQGCPGGDGDGDPLPPSISYECDTDLDSPYFLVACYFDTKEGTVIARHYEDAKTVKVTMRHPARSGSLMRAVRSILGENGEAPDDLTEEAA